MENKELLKKYFNRTISQQEYQALKIWINSSDENRQQFESLVKANYLHCMIESEIDVNPSTYQFFHRKAKLHRIIRRLAIGGISTAATLLLSFTIYQVIAKFSIEETVVMANNNLENVVLTVFNTEEGRNGLDTSTIYQRMEIDQKEKSNHLQMIDTMNGIKILSLKVPTKLDYKVTLEDGTVVWINSDSELRYPNHFSKNVREVYIDGEAAFDVVKDQNRPFIVTTSNSRIKVLGTVFNVNSYMGTNQSNTTLISGKIELTVGDQVVLLKPNEKAIVEKDRSEIQIVPYEGDRAIAWITGKYYFDAKPLTEILSVLSRWYDVKFTFTKDSINDLTFTGAINKNMAIEDIINMLTETVEFEYEIKDYKNIKIICN